MRIENQEQLNEILKGNPDLADANRRSAPEVGFLVHQDAKPQKYRSRRTVYNNVTYHSAKEAAKAQELDLLVKAGLINFYLRQVPFDLGGNPPIVYRADFMVYTKLLGGYWWLIKVIEVKGYETKEWKLKQKLFRATYPNLSLEVC